MNFLSQVRSLVTSRPIRRRKRPSACRLTLEELERRLIPAVTIAVNATANVHPIDPNIYGSSYATTAQLADLNLTLNRAGGNTTSTYNWQQDASNHANDYYFESIADGSGTPGASMDNFVNSTKAAGAQASLTIPMLDYVAKLGPNRSILPSYSVTKYGSQKSTDPYLPDAGNGVLSNGQAITWNDPLDANTPNSVGLQQSWIQHLISTFGNSSAGGVRYYTMDNEPGLWNSTHQDTHPNGDTMTELRDKIIAYASMVKALDPNAKILGPEEWGWTNYFIDGADAAAHNWGATYNGLAAMPWLLDQLRQHDGGTGQRLLDYFTLHYYPQSGEFGNDVSQATELLRNQSTRSLWDPNYVDQSWIGGTGINGGKVQLIPMMRNWVNTYYPGTKIGITEYNWGADGNMNGATTQADIWGIFGREGLDLANRWGTPNAGTPTYLAMKMYRNYDGNDSTFGDTSVSATVPNPDQVAAYAAIRSSDGALTIMVINKNLYNPANPSATTSITLNLSNFANTGVAQQWQLAAINGSNQNNAAITHLSNISFSGNTFTLSVPMESVELFVIAPATSAPATPTGLNATAGNTQVGLSWNPVPGATSYNIYRATTPGGEGTTVYKNVTATTYTDTGLTNGVTYYYQVSALNGAGQSAKSGEVSATPQSVPATPTGVTATAGNAQVTLSWSASTGATSYNIYRATTSGGEGNTVYKNVTANSYTDIGLTNGITYYYQISAANGVGQSGKSGEVSATPQSAPATPTGVTATAGNAQVTLSWSASTAATSYNIFRATTPGGEGITVYQNVTTLSFTDTGLTNGITYYYQVSALNGAGPSAKSSEVSATPQPVPATPTGVTATAGNAQVTLSWSIVTGATNYNIFRATTPGGEGTTVYKNVTATTFIDTGLTNGVKYYYQVSAVNGVGQSVKSGEVSATPQQPNNLSPKPSILVASADAGVAPEVKVFDAATGALKFDFLAYDAAFRGGVRIAVGDVNSDGVPDIITAPGPNGGSVIMVFDGKTSNPLAAFAAITTGQSGSFIGQAIAFGTNSAGTNLNAGFYVAAGDLNGDGFADIIIGFDGSASGPLVNIYSGKVIASGQDPAFLGQGMLASYNAFPAPGGGVQFNGGVRVAAGDIDGDGKADVVAVPGVGGGPLVSVYSGALLTQNNNVNNAAFLISFNAYPVAGWPSTGLFVAVGDLDHDGFSDIILGPGGSGGGSSLLIISSKALLAQFKLTPNQIDAAVVSQAPIALPALPYSPPYLFPNGIHVGTADVNGDGFADILLGGGPGNGSMLDTFLSNTGGTTTPGAMLDAFGGIVSGIFVA